MTTPWFYVLTMSLPGSHTSILASYRGVVDVGPDALPLEIFEYARTQAVEAISRDSGVDASRASTVFWHAEPNIPVGGTSPAPPAQVGPTAE